MSTKKATNKSIKNADIHVGPLPLNYYPKNGNQESSLLFSIFIDGEVLKTPAGAPIVHQDDKPLREMAAELEFMDHLDVKKVSLYGLCCSQIDFLEKKKPNFGVDDFREWLLNDSALKTCAGPEVADQMKYMRVIEEFLGKYGIKYPHLPQIPLGQTGLNIARMGGDLGDLDDQNFETFYTLANDENFNQLVDQFFSIYKQFDIYQLTVFIVSSSVFNSPTLSMMLVLHAISPKELAIVYMMANGMAGKVWGLSSRKEEQGFARELEQTAECFYRYLSQFPPKLPEIEEMIRGGESIQLEFKSTLRWNLRSNQSDPAMEHAVLKSVVAFLNSNGGTLLVGVEDDGNVLGIEVDGFKNEDKYLLHFSNLVNDKIGKKHVDHIKWELVRVKEMKVLKVECKRSNAPVFLRFNGKEEFFIRTGPSTVQLTASELLEYFKSHFDS